MMCIGITGGIGSGKSMVSAIIEKMGYPVYNADNRAKWLISNCDDLIESIKQVFGSEAYLNGEYNRNYIASRVFANKYLLDELNAAVHPAVASDFISWTKQNGSSNLLFMEAAILFESNFDRMLSKVIAVTAPDEIRINRVIKRDYAVREQVLSRINNQMPTSELIKKSDFVIVNDEQQLLVPQIVEVIKLLRA